MPSLVPYLYIAPAFAVTLVFSFVAMGVSFWASLHHYDAFAGASEFAGLATKHELVVPVAQHRPPVVGIAGDLPVGANRDLAVTEAISHDIRD
mgnify:CR=1 FL=1